MMINITLIILIVTSLALLAYGIYRKRRHESRLLALTKEMDALNGRLPAMEQQKSEFVAIVSHQLRAPLTTIKGYASMILEGSFGTISSEIRDAANKLYLSSEKIIALVENLITMSQIEQGKMELSLRPQNFVDFIKSVLTNTESKIKEAELTLSFTIEEGSESVLIDMDEKKLRQVVLHLLENAILYTPAHGTMKVAVSTNQEEKRIRLAVSDSGIGMTDEQIKALFERFDLAVSREGEISSRVNHPEGNKVKTVSFGNKAPGIGTYIAKKIVHTHHGDFWAESGGANNGTTFIVDLPFAKGI
ncbi:MAG: HAMP domain-containing histidine kinase [Candidatus Yonathbacteria bacterium]|nr:HAMP domain-containing histidine kinase [Candidatus Yonathbacteria bacterium]